MADWRPQGRPIVPKTEVRGKDVQTRCPTRAKIKVARALSIDNGVTTKRIVADVTELVGNTPLVYLNKVTQARLISAPLPPQTIAGL